MATKCIIFIYMCRRYILEAPVLLAEELYPSFIYRCNITGLVMEQNNKYFYAGLCYMSEWIFRDCLKACRNLRIGSPGCLCTFLSFPMKRGTRVTSTHGMECQHIASHLSLSRWLHTVLMWKCLNVRPVPNATQMEMPGYLSRN